MPDLSIENTLIKQGFKNIIGIDEVGRGCLAGPVIACATIYPFNLDKNTLHNINDSKKLTSKKREFLYPTLCNNINYALGIVDNITIDKINILQATFLAMEKAILNLNISADALNQSALIIDGNIIPAFKNLKPKLAKAIIKGDQKSTSIACASIIAKVYRDNLMNEYHLENEKYSWKSNKGYPTKKHKQAISSFGLTALHRLSFKI